MASEVVYFKVHGSAVTAQMRTFILEGEIEKSWNVFNSLHDGDKHSPELLSIFADILKGKKAFTGVNDLELIEANSPNFVQTSLDLLTRNLFNTKQYKAYIEKKTEDSNGLYQLMEEEDGPQYTFDQIAAIKNQNKRDESDCLKSLDFLRTLVGVTEDEIQLSILKRHARESLQSNYGWITEKGWFIPVSYSKHDEFIDQYNLEINGALTVADLEKKWVRITGLLGVTISAFEFTMSAKQKITLEKWLKHHNYLSKSGDSIDIFGNGEVVNEDGQIKFIRGRY